MIIRCKLCGQVFNVAPDILDKQLDMREACGLLIRHLSHSHGARLGNVAARLQAIEAAILGYFPIQEFAIPDSMWAEEFHRHLVILRQMIIDIVDNNMEALRREEMPSGYTNQSGKVSN